VKKNLILIAEDDVDDRFLLQTAFDEGGDHELLDFVGNGVEVINYLDSIASDGGHSYPEIIMLDLNMPKKDGKEVLKELKQHPVYKKIPVIVYTTTKNEVEVRKCYELGANTYIVKPITFDALRKVVESIKSYWLGTACIPDYSECEMPLEFK
jgi:CheY-like chemotaxis protein